MSRRDVQKSIAVDVGRYTFVKFNTEYSLDHLQLPVVEGYLEKNQSKSIQVPDQHLLNNHRMNSGKKKNYNRRLQG